MSGKAQSADDIIAELAKSPVDDSMKVDKKICSGGKSYPVHLSFDDGPSPTITPRVLDILKKANIKATFFISTESLVKGKPKDINARKELIERMKREGHTIGSHSYAHIEHANSTTTSQQSMMENLKKSFVEMDKLNLPKPLPFRFPYGSGWNVESVPANQKMANFAMNAIKGAGYYPFHWDIDTKDWSKIKRKALPVSALEQICSSKGGVMLMHDVHKWTADNLPVLIESVRQSGHTFVSEPEIRDYSENRASKPLVSLADHLGGPQGCVYVGHLDRAGSKCNTGNNRNTGNTEGVQ
ncbi:polysaccharide deacetylase family protein [Bdellovibrio sp. HCB290]|uniref:polysaccharide deacetylase family protein n=1 Tax=Bdellovibrio sp. HCB290 TaxID=3394356 RepID=UPI0039B4BF5D